MKVKLIPIVVGVVGAIPKSQGQKESEISSKIEIIQTTPLLKTVRLLRRVLKTWLDLLPLRLQWKNIANAGVKKFDRAYLWYMHNPASVLENDIHKLLWDFNIQIDHLISTRRPGLIIINKKKENLQNCRLYCPGWPQNKTRKNVKREITTSTLLENWKNCGTWRWQLYQLWLVLLAR